MNFKTHYLIMTVAAGFFCAAASGQVEQSLSGEKPLLISQYHPAFVGIDTLHVVVLQYGAKQDKDVRLYKQLEENVKENLRQAGIKLYTPTADNMQSIPELRIYISMLSLEDSQQYVFHVRTALARAVCLKDKQNPVFKADIWQVAPLIQAISAENMPAKITDAVLEQVEGFTNIYKATNLTSKQLLEVNTNETDSSIVPEKQVDAAEHKYVASKSSMIFHKPNCRWAINISQKNVVTYKSKDEAIKAGKRPCKTCNP